MAKTWYYVSKGQRKGPEDEATIKAMLKKQELTPEDFLWKKGFENWQKIKDVLDFQESQQEEDLLPPPMDDFNHKEFKLSELDEDEKVIFVRIGVDRGGAPAEYGPYSINTLKKLYQEKRINGKTQIFAKDLMQTWTFLADVQDYQNLFDEMPPVIEEVDRRKWLRKPFVARMLVQANKKVYEGLCRDISIGGMQVLMASIPAKAGDKIAINVHPDNTDYHFTASGTVVRIIEGNQGFSFRFDALNSQAKNAIEKYIQDADASITLS
jgi:hypothetical protein